MGDDRALNETEMAKLLTLKAQCQTWRTRKCQLFKQYSRVRNLTLKDENTKYFHSIASLNRRCNKLTNIEMNEVVFYGMEGIKSEIRKHFEHSYHQEALAQIILPLGSFKKFNQAAIYLMDEIPDGEEIKMLSEDVIQTKLQAMMDIKSAL